MFTVLGGVDDAASWISNGILGWIILNPLVLSFAITIIVVLLYVHYGPESDSDEPENDLTKFTFFAFLAIFLPLLINNNIIDRKRGGSELSNLEMSEDDFI
jgi:hypothetical protein